MNSFIEKELRKEFLRLSQEARKNMERETRRNGIVRVKIILPTKGEKKTSEPS